MCIRNVSKAQSLKKMEKRIRERTKKEKQKDGEGEGEEEKKKEVDENKEDEMKCWIVRQNISIMAMKR